MTKKLLFIVNPKAGTRRGEAVLGEILQDERIDPCETAVMTTAAGGDARRFAHEHGGEADLVLCIGGDGTFSEVVSGLIAGGHGTPLAFIPAGSTNDFAASLGLPADPAGAVACALHGTCRAFDIGTLNGRPFAYVAAFGMFARISYAAPQDLKNALGRFAYVLQGIRDFHTLRAEPMTVTIDGETIEGSFLLGTISNTTSIGGVLQFGADDVKLDDGFLEVLLIARPASPLELAQLLHALTTREYAQCPCIVCAKGRSIRIAAQNVVPWTVDGEQADETRDAVIDTLPAAIRVMTPGGD